MNKINPNITIKEVNESFKLIRERAKNNPKMTFKDFSDYELFIYSIIDTCNFGRSFQDSVKNALCHLKDNESKNQYLKILLNKDIEEDLI